MSTAPTTRTVMRSVFANPSVTPLLVFSLVVTGLFAWYHWGRHAWDDWQFEQTKHWTAQRWAFTTDDFRGHTAAEVSVDDWWMSDDLGPGPEVDPVRLPGLSPLFHFFLGYGASWMPDGSGEVSGVRVDGVDVYAHVSTTPDVDLAGPDGAPEVRFLQENAMQVGQYLLEPGARWPRIQRVEVLTADYVGAPVPGGGLWRNSDEPFDPGPAGHFGVTTHQRAADGDLFRTTTLATVAEGALVVVGVVVPDGVEPAADLDPAVLLERLTAEVRADPPTHSPAQDENAPGEQAQADSRTTSDVGSVIAAGS